MKYRTIVADPPWDTKAGPASGAYKVVDGAQVWNLASTKTRDLAYPSLTVEEIKALPVSRLAEEDAHLYLWTTNGYLPQAFEVLRAWGFRYSTTLVWAKTPFGGGGLGGAWRITTEFLLFARRGSLGHRGYIIGTWFHDKREYDERGKPQHSRKPAVWQDRIEQVSPGPYLELFARAQRLGWDTWGNECFEHVSLPSVSEPRSSNACLRCEAVITDVFGSVAGLCPRCVESMRCWRCGEPVAGLFPYLLCEPCVGVVSEEEIAWLNDRTNQPFLRSWEMRPMGKVQGA